MSFLQAQNPQADTCNNDFFTTPLGVPISMDVLANDVGNLMTGPAVFGGPSNGTISWDPTTGRYTYTPDSTFCGIGFF